MNYNGKNLYNNKIESDGDNKNIYDKQYHGDTYYLDCFMRDCLTNKDRRINQKRTAAFKSFSTIFLLMLFGACIVVALLAYYVGKNEVIKIVLPLMITLPLLLIIIHILLFIHKKYAVPEQINYNYIQYFLTTTNIPAFDCYNAPFCINNGKTALGKKYYQLHQIYIAILIVYIILTVTFVINTYGNQFYTNVNSILILFSITIFLFVDYYFVFAFVKQLIQKKICTEKVDAVCVRVDNQNNKISLSVSHIPLRGTYHSYRPFYYIKYQNKGYILFNKEWTNINVPKIGDIRNIYINPDDPLEYYEKMSISQLIYNILFIATFFCAAICCLLYNI